MNLTREHWTQADYNDFIKYLKTLADSKYKEFSDSLVPGIEHSFGIRIPILRDTAKKISKGNYNEFLACKKGVYREEIMLEGLVMTLIKCDYPQMLEYIKVFADKITSWETCDVVSFKGLKKHLDEFFSDIEYFIYHENPWVVRFGFGCLLEFYLTDEYIDRVLEYVDSINSDFYYVQMMQGWLIATAVAKCRDKAIKFLQYNNLNATTQNMAVRKIRESNRISKEDKDLVIQFKK
ncbi:MAG: DNA alkylation repair protein [Clostridia bacterium]|nr:DNA alkylation repair protein [Clostridia bacterium]MCI8980666.1 DNA alkylation repair protein [Clostridia bacterium]MCI9086121.1 DNA alkylation repair protein [Clostridia bacterium]NDO19191.1 DNA alkylation repair protein [Lachnospiraceae bacterium MD329]